MVDQIIENLTNNTITEADLTYEKLSEHEAQLLIKALAANQSLKQLSLGGKYSEISLENMLGILEALQQHPMLMSLTLDQIDQTNNRLIQLSASFSSSYLSHNDHPFMKIQDEIERLTQLNRQIQTQFLQACAAGEMASVLKYLNQGASIYSKDSAGNTGLHLAAQNNQLEVVKLLLQKKAAIQVLNNQNETPRMLAQDMRIQPLLASSHAASNKQEVSANSSSLDAAAPVYIDAPKKLCCPLTQKIMQDPVIASDGHTYEREAIEAHIEKIGISPLTQQPLQKGVLIPNQYVKADITDFLAQYRAQLDPTALYLSATAFTTLIEAIERHQFEAFKKHLDNDPRLLTRELKVGRTVFHIACESGTWDMMQEVVTRLGEGLITVLQMPTPENWRPVVLNEELISRAHQGDRPAVEQLIKLGADIQAEDNNGYTALDYALMGDQKNVAILLMEARLQAENQAHNPAALTMRDYAYISLKIAYEQLQRLQPKLLKDRTTNHQQKVEPLSDNNNNSLTNIGPLTQSRFFSDSSLNTSANSNIVAPEQTIPNQAKRGNRN